jgi:hypothetical protein
MVPYSMNAASKPTKRHVPTRFNMAWRWIFRAPLLLRWWLEGKEPVPPFRDPRER